MVIFHSYVSLPEGNKGEFKTHGWHITQPKSSSNPIINEQKSSTMACPVQLRSKRLRKPESDTFSGLSPKPRNKLIILVGSPPHFRDQKSTIWDCSITMFDGSALILWWSSHYCCRSSPPFDVLGQENCHVWSWNHVKLTCWSGSIAISDG